MNLLPQKNLWFLSILSNYNLKQYLFNEILRPGENDSSDADLIFNVLRNHNLHNYKIEGVDGLYYRTLRLKKFLKNELQYNYEIK